MSIFSEFFNDSKEFISSGEFVDPLGIFGSIFGGEDIDTGRIEELMAQGVSEAVATQQEFLERSLGFLEPFQEAGVGALPFLQKELTAEGLSPLSQLQLRTGQESIEKGLGDIGQFTSGLRTEQFGELGERVGAEDIQRRLNIAQGLTGLGAQTAGQAAGLTFGTGGGIASTQLGGRLGAASLLAGQAGQEGLFGRNTGDILQTAAIAAPFFL